MTNFIKKQRTVSLVCNVVVIILGILLCALKGNALSVLERIASTILIVYGAISLIVFCFTPILIRNGQDLMESIVILIFGIILDFFPALFILGIGIMLVFEGLREISYAVDLKKINDNNWWVDFISGSVVFALGLVVVILCNTTIASNIVSLLLGISLIINGATNIILISTLKREFTSVRKFVKETDDGFTDYKIQ